uniref:Uncharacterized protein n=1 Tax=Anopheles albimanus TaxID=7167 RepID=A0A182FYB9_ANOAL
MRSACGCDPLFHPHPLLSPAPEPSMTWNP